jgi:hypothetical protein
MTASAGQAGNAARPIALFVMGTPRSGSSALTRVLSLCGGGLPAELKGADSGNPRGYWEPAAAARISDAILQRHDSTWFDPSLRIQEEGVFDAEEKSACIAEISAFLTTLPAAPFVVIKEGGATTLSEMWFEAASLAGFDIAVVIAVRSPREAIPSLAKHMQASPEFASALWLKYSLLSERNARRVPRVFIDYANLLDDWRREIGRISAALALDLNTRDEGAIDEFLTPDLRRERNAGPVAEPFDTDWISTVYGALSAAAQDEPCDGNALDRVFAAYRASDHAFRTVFEDFRRLHPTRGLFLRLFRRALIVEVRRLDDR